MKFGPGCNCCGPCESSLCVLVSGGCDGKPVRASVTVTQDGDPVANCITVGEVASVARQGLGGSGYTNGTGYALGFSGGGGSGAAGTFDVVAGRVTNLVLTNPGTGYTGVPTISFPGAGSGTGALGVATMRSRCCVDLPDKGSYQVAVASDGFNTATTTVTAVCGSNTTSVALVKTSGTCCNGCPTPTTSTTQALTDANSSTVLSYSIAEAGWKGCYTFTSGQVVSKDPPPDPQLPVYCDVITACDQSKYITGSVGVVYVLKCTGGNWTLTQRWLACNCVLFTCPALPVWRGFQLSEATSACELQALPGAVCGPLPAEVTVPASEVVCDPFQLSFNFPTHTGSGGPVPAPGPVVVTLP